MEFKCDRGITHVDTSSQALIDAHDDVASKNYEALPDSMSIVPVNQAPTFTVHETTDAIRMVGIKKSPDESLVFWFCFLRNYECCCQGCISKAAYLENEFLQRFIQA